MANTLFPVFLNIENLNLLVIGGGSVGLEKVTSIFRNSPQTKVHLIAPEICTGISQLAKKHPSLILQQKKYAPDDLRDMDIVVAATSISVLNKQIWADAKMRKILINVADTPALCDFYMCSIVQKGNLKIGISSNGLSPTITKRLREALEDALPEEIDELLKNLKDIRETLKGDFEYKVKKMNEITSVFKEQPKK